MAKAVTATTGTWRVSGSSAGAYSALRLDKLTTHAFNSGVAAHALVPVDGHGGLLIAPP